MCCRGRARPYAHQHTPTHPHPHPHPHAGAHCSSLLISALLFSDLQQYLAKLPFVQPNLRTYFMNQVLCRTLTDNHCYLLTITTLGADSPVPITQRPVVFISGRCHLLVPYETIHNFLCRERVSCPPTPTFTVTCPRRVVCGCVCGSVWLCVR